MTGNQLPWLWIIGIGDDGLAGLTSDAAKLVKAADVLVGGERHLGFVDDVLGQKKIPQKIAWPSPWAAMETELKALKTAGKNVCVLASGDPFWCGAGSLVAKHFERDEWISIPHASAFQLAAHRMGWSLQSCTCVSLHGRPAAGIKQHLGAGGRVLALAEAGTARQLTAILEACDFEHIAIQCLEHMGGDREKSYTYASGDTADLVTLAFDLGEARLVPPLAGLPDAAFEHDGQLTKQDVRAVTLAKLAPAPGELLWDLGAGSGAIAIEWCRLQPSARALAVEHSLPRIQRIKRNARKLAAFNLETARQSVNDPLDGDTPDAIFIGGGLNADLLRACWAKLPSGGRLVANAVTLESETLLTGFPASVDIDPVTCLARIAVERPIKVGDKVAWKPSMTVTQLAMVKP